MQVKIEKKWIAAIAIVSEHNERQKLISLSSCIAHACISILLYFSTSISASISPTVTSLGQCLQGKKTVGLRVTAAFLNTAFTDLQDKSVSKITHKSGHNCCQS